jgi:hypothetical protein
MASAEGLSKPFLIVAAPACPDGGVKVMILGQQDMGWGEDTGDVAASVGTPMKAYNDEGANVCV